jgi:hypothetical protein
MSPKTPQPNQSIASTSISDVIQGRRCHRPADFVVVTTKSYDNPSLSGVNHVTAASPILKWARSDQAAETLRCDVQETLNRYFPGSEASKCCVIFSIACDDERERCEQRRKLGLRGPVSGPRTADPPNGPEFDCPDAAHDGMATNKPVTRANAVERVTRIELAWPAWKDATAVLAGGHRVVCVRFQLTPDDCDSPCVMAR